MLKQKKEHLKEKSILHSRNKHRQRYDFKQLVDSCKELAPFVRLNEYKDESIDFFNPEAVKMLNKALLKYYYDIEYWDIPKAYLCPPIPGRADYTHYIADLLGSSNDGKIPTGDKIKCIDIGVGANCVYPIIGNKEYGWNFVGTDIDMVSITSATKIIEMNSFLKDKIEIRKQNNPKDIFNGIITKDELFDVSICNPPFHASAKDAQIGTFRKLSNLKNKKVKDIILNFGGVNNELWCEGGEERFVKDMIKESKQFSTSCLWFSTLVSKEASLAFIYDTLKIVKAVDIKTIPMGQGNKISRIVAWTFHTKEQQKNWVDARWN